MILFTHNLVLYNYNKFNGGYMKILITGGDSNIGTFLSSFFKEKYTPICLNKKLLDVTNKTLVLDTLCSLKPDLVIDTAGIENLNFCERNESIAYKVNSIGAFNVAYACYLLDIPILYISSSQVFDGTKELPYYETDVTNPINVYGKTKLAGEMLIKTICSRYYIIRTSNIFGTKYSFIDSILNSNSEIIPIVSNEITNITFIKDLSISIEIIMNSGIFGTYNCVNTGAISKINLIKEILNLNHINKKIITLPLESISANAPLPLFTALDTSLIKNCFNIEIPSYKISLMQYYK